MGPGSFSATGGTFTVTGAVQVTNLNLSGSTLAGTHSFGGTLAWISSSLNTAGSTTIAGDGTMTIGTVADHDFNGRSLVNQGTVNWTGGRLRSGDGGSILNSGTWNDSASSVVNADWGNHVASFTNSGVFQKTATGLTSIQIPFTNNQGSVLVSAGTLRFSSSFTQTSGTIAVSQGASVQFDQGLNLAAGTLTGSGTVIADVSNQGLLSPGASPGQLNVTGSLTLTSTSTLLIELGGDHQGVSYDFLSVSGTANLDGLLRIGFVNGYESVLGTSTTFTILSANTLVGAFANAPVTGLRLSTLDGLGSFQVNFGTGSLFAANSVVLSNFVAVPEPSTWALLIAGVLVVAFQLRRHRR